MPDFYFTGDEYKYRFEPEAKERFLDLLRERFNSAVRYKGHASKWDTVIEQKTVELCRYLFGRSSRIDFSDPNSMLSRTDSQQIRASILRLSQSEAETFGIRKSTLCHLRKKARNAHSFKIHRKTLMRIALTAETHS